MSVPARVLDILETDGGILTFDGLMMEYESRFGHTPRPETVYRALYRLRDRGQVESVPCMRLVPTPDRERNGGPWSGKVREKMGHTVRDINDWRAT